MSRVRNKDTKPEIAVRRLVHRMGYRYRLHRRDLPGNPDLVFANRGKIIFVHGCFGHRHGTTCHLTRWPKSKLEFWKPKLEENYRRDAATRRALRKMGWKTLVVWECELGNGTRLEKWSPAWSGDCPAGLLRSDSTGSRRQPPDLVFNLLRRPS